MNPEVGAVSVKSYDINLTLNPALSIPLQLNNELQLNMLGSIVFMRGIYSLAGRGFKKPFLGLASVWVPSDGDPEGRLITARGLCEFTRPYFAGNFYLEIASPN